MDLDFGYIKLDFKGNTGELTELTVVQNDSRARGFYVELVNEKGETVDIEDTGWECYLFTRFKGADKTYYSEGEMVDYDGIKVFKVPFVTEQLQETGKLNIQILIKSQDGREICQSKPLELWVYESLSQMGGEEGKSYYLDFMDLKETIKVNNKLAEDLKSKYEILNNSYENFIKSNLNPILLIEKVDYDNLSDMEKDKDVIYGVIE